MNIVRPFLARAKVQPWLPAVTFNQDSTAYGELAERSGRLAAAMANDISLKRHDRVVIYMENNAHYLNVLLAIWTAGLSAVPVNAKLHPKEVVGIANECRAGAIFSSTALLTDLCPLYSGHIAPFIVNCDSNEYKEFVNSSTRESMSPAETQPDDVAWLFFTSGTTGKPKGAMLTHRNLVSMALMYSADIERIAPGDTTIHTAPLSHGSGLYALPSLFAGGNQVIGQTFSPETVFQFINRYPNVSMFVAPTMIFRFLKYYESLPEDSKPSFANLRTIIYGGGPMYVGDLVRALRVFGPKLYHLYGQGESPMTISGLTREEHEGDFGEAHMELLRSCGHVRTGVEIKIVDTQGHELAAGEVGEIVTRSDCVMKGYWENDSATSAAVDSNGWLYTGDLGAVNTRGLLTLHDRSKDVIIRASSNIYPREVEEVLLRHPAISECAVVGRRHEDVGEEPVAFIVRRGIIPLVPQADVCIATIGSSATDSEIHLISQSLDELCLHNLGRYKRPREYIFVSQLPKNNYGKVLKTELRKQLIAGTV